MLKIYILHILVDFVELELTNSL